MLSLTRRHRAGFTLVEIMIVVAIIALLAALAVPGFLRARKRSQATVVLNDARVLDGAKDQYAIETNRLGPDLVQPGNLTGYLKPGTRLYNACKASSIPTDIMGNTYLFTNFDTGVRVNATTQSNFTDVIDNYTAFWANFF